NALWHNLFTSLVMASFDRIHHITLISQGQRGFFIYFGGDSGFSPSKGMGFRMVSLPEAFDGGPHLPRRGETGARPWRDLSPVPAVHLTRPFCSKVGRRLI
ncbi:MAG: hypothetical protein AB1896_07370, partial [Thermodesulfobacteriota bacterium]